MAEVAEAKAPDPARPLCWICNRNEANSGEHKTKRSDLLAVLGEPTQEEPFYFHDLERRNRPLGSLNAKILKAPIRICAECNTTRTQPHDRAWEEMSDGLRARRDKVGQWVREIAPEVTGHGLPLSKCEAYKRVYDQPYGSS